MPDQATLNHAARVVAASDEQRTDAALRAYFTSHRYLGPRERRAISRTAFAYYRWLQWLDPKASKQRQLEQAAELQKRFDADPKSVKPEALAVRAVPAWLREEMELPKEFLQLLQREPALWIRARPGTVPTLAEALGNCEPAGLVLSSEFKVLSSGTSTPNSELRTPNLGADALRYVGPQDLFRTVEFSAGKFEIQDLASQLVGEACAPQPGETWWDTCAGEGGKTLHLADLMQNKGVVWASDRHSGRLETLKRRARRANLFNYRTALWDGGPKLPSKTKFDGILIDAPCSGVGTWRRNPQARWTTTPDDVRELAATQLALLNHVAGSLKPGGRLIYSVCTLTRSETTAVADAFSATHPELEPIPVFPKVQRPESKVQSPTSGQLCVVRGPWSVMLWPHELNANGMFIATWRKK